MAEPDTSVMLPAGVASPGKCPAVQVVDVPVWTPLSGRRASVTFRRTPGRNEGKRGVPTLSAAGLLLRGG